MADFVTADWHFNHAGILAFERGQFKSTQEHDSYIISQYNSVVSDEDTCYVLGDVGFSNVAIVGSCVKRLHGKKILILGNHDRFDKNDYLAMGFSEVVKGPVYYGDEPDARCFAGRILLSHEPAREAYCNGYIINVHGHLHNSDLDLYNFFNVNVARTDYKPQSMRIFTEKARSLRPRQETFGDEWYYPYYKWDADKKPSSF